MAHELTLVPIVWFVILIGLLALFIYCLMKASEEKRWGKNLKHTVEAKVIRVEEITRNPNSIKHKSIVSAPTLLFVINETEYTVQWTKGKSGNIKKYKQGQLITIKYDVNNPEQICIPGDFQASEEVSIFVLGIIISICGLVGMISYYFFGIDVRFWL